MQTITRSIWTVACLALGAGFGGCAIPQTSEPQVQRYPIEGAPAAIAALEARVDIAASNLANAGTYGFKASRLMVEEGPGGRGVRAIGIRLDMTTGAPVQTSQPLDAFINGDGFFCVANENGRLWTRFGKFYVDKDGDLAIYGSSQYKVSPVISVPPQARNLIISADGRVTCIEVNAADSTELGQIETATFASPEHLQPMGACLYAQTADSGPPRIGTPTSEGRGELMQGAVEGSNVDPIRETIEIASLRRQLDLWYHLVMNDASAGYASARR